MRYEYNDDDDGVIIVRDENITDLMGRVGLEKSPKLEILAKDPIRRFAKQMGGLTLNQIYPKRMISNSTEKSFTWGALYRWSHCMVTSYDQSNPLTLTPPPAPIYLYWLSITFRITELKIWFYNSVYSKLRSLILLPLVEFEDGTFQVTVGERWPRRIKISHVHLYRMHMNV